jgi:hypothetical protein
MITLEDTDEMRKCAFKKRPYRADVEVTLAELAAPPVSPMPAYLSVLATGFDSMTDVAYRVVDWKDDADSTLIISVSGRVEQVVTDMKAAQTS